MSTSTTASGAIRRPAPDTDEKSQVISKPVTFIRVVRSEWIKLRSLRSSWTMLAAASAGMVAIGLITAFTTRHAAPRQSANELGHSACLQGIYLAQLLIGALGVLYVSTEFATGVIGSTFSAVPTRVPVLAAKAVVISIVSALTITLISLLTFLASQALIGHYRTGYSLSDLTSIRVVVGTGIYVTLIGLLGSAIGWIVRSTPGSLTALFGLILVVPAIVSAAFGDSGYHVLNYLPTSAFSLTTDPEPRHTLGPWTSLVVLGFWVVAALAAAVITLRSRDA